MKKLFEDWNEFVNEAERIKIWSVYARVEVKKPVGHAAVIDDTLALIRAIPSITVVNSDTDQARSSVHKAVLDVEFKFTPRSSSILTDLKAIRNDILGVSVLVVGCSQAQEMYSSKKRIQ